VEASGERNRVLYVLKSRGMKHSNQMREYLLTDHGIHLIEPYVGAHGVLTGSARLAQEAAERDSAIERTQASARRHRDLSRKRATIERQIAEMHAMLQAEEEEAAMVREQEQVHEGVLTEDRVAMAVKRGAAA